MSNSFIKKSKYESINIEMEISRAKSYDDFIKLFEGELLEQNALGESLNALLIRYPGIVTGASELAGLNRTYLSKIISGKKPNPSRDTLIAICVVLGASFEETQNVLKCGGKQPLYVRNKRDVIIWFCLKRHESIGDINKCLEDHGFKDLSSKKKK